MILISDGPTFTKFNEGLTLEAKCDPPGSQRYEIGYGHNAEDIGPDTVWSEDQADVAFGYDYQLALRNASQIIGPTWPGIGSARQAAWTDLAYELGLTGLSQFVHAIAYAQEEDWDGAAREIAASAYENEVPARCARVCALIRTGDWGSLVGLT